MCLAAVGALILPWLLAAFTAMPVYRMLSVQVVAFVILTAFFCWTPMVPPAVAPVPEEKLA